jgi:hypothetical protein
MGRRIKRRWTSVVVDVCSGRRSIILRLMGMGRSIGVSGTTEESTVTKLLIK